MHRVVNMASRCNRSSRLDGQGTCAVCFVGATTRCFCEIENTACKCLSCCWWVFASWWRGSEAPGECARRKPLILFRCIARAHSLFFFFLLCCQKGRLVVSSHVLGYALPRDILVIQHCTFRGLMLCTFVSSRSGVDAGTIACVHVLHEPSRMGLRRALDGSLWKREVWPSPVENLQKRQQKRDKSSQTVALSTPPLCLHDGPNGPRGISFINRMIS